MELVELLAGTVTRQLLGEFTQTDLDACTDQIDEPTGGCAAAIAVRYGTSVDLSFALAARHWPGQMSPGYTNGLDRNGAHVFQLCSEQVFQLSFPRDQVLHQAFPAALVKGQLPG